MGFPRVLCLLILAAAVSTVALETIRPHTSPHCTSNVGGGRCPPGFDDVSPSHGFPTGLLEYLRSKVVIARSEQEVHPHLLGGSGTHCVRTLCTPCIFFVDNLPNTGVLFVVAR